MGAMMRWVEEDGSARLVDKRKGETVAGDWLAGVSSTSGCFKVFEGEVGWGGGLGCGKNGKAVASLAQDAASFAHCI